MNASLQISSQFSFLNAPQQTDTRKGTVHPKTSGHAPSCRIQHRKCSAGTHRCLPGLCAITAPPRDVGPGTARQAERHAAHPLVPPIWRFPLFISSFIYHDSIPAKERCACGQGIKWSKCSTLIKEDSHSCWREKNTILVILKYV